MKTTMQELCLLQKKRFGQTGHFVPPDKRGVFQAKFFWFVQGSKFKANPHTHRDLECAAVDVLLLFVVPCCCYCCCSHTKNRDYEYVLVEHPSPFQWQHREKRHKTKQQTKHGADSSNYWQGKAQCSRLSVAFASSQKFRYSTTGPSIRAAAAAAGASASAVPSVQRHGKQQQ